MRYIINAPLVIADNLDNEVIILSMETGKYFSAPTTGAVVWQLLSGGYSVEEAGQKMAEHFGVELEQVIQDLDELKAQFLHYHLIKETAVEITLPSVKFPDKLDYVKPGMTAYSDMEKLLLVDPIHEVENMGWPNIKNDAG